jgi:hypothetical protein
MPEPDGSPGIRKIFRAVAGPERQSAAVEIHNHLRFIVTSVDQIDFARNGRAGRGAFSVYHPSRGIEMK